MKETPNQSKYLFAVFVLLLCFFNFMKIPSNALSWDVFGYYLYLPAKFTYHDLGIHHKDWLDALLLKYNPTGTFYQASQLADGTWVMKYSMGLAVVYAPFFFIAQLIAEPLGYPADGLSLPYQYSLIAGGIIYFAIGLWFLGKILSVYFDKRTTNLVLFIIFLGTNLLQLTAFTGVLASHSFLFAFYAILVYYTIKWHAAPKLWYATIIGTMIGICTLIRPTEIIGGLIPLLWGIKDKASFIAKWNLLKRYIGHILLIGFIVVLFGLPQIYYWKKFTGHFFFYSYNNPGEGLDFLSPHTYKFLFSFRKGWFIYTPIMLFSMVGFYYLYKYKRELFLTILLFFILDLYIISSWTNWWYAGGSYSSRTIAPAYVLLALPLGYFITKVQSSGKVTRWSVGSLFGLLIALNLFQTYQFQIGVIDGERMTRPYYFAIFGKTHATDEDRKLLMVNRSYDGVEQLKDESNYTRKMLYENRFDTSVVDSLQGTKGQLVMTEKNQYSPGPNVKYKDITGYNHAWLRINVKVFLPDSFADKPPTLVASFHHLSLRKNEEGYKYITKEYKKEDLKLGSWNIFSMDYMTPEVRSREDNLKIYIWYTGKQPVLIDDFTVEAFEPKVEYE